MGTRRAVVAHQGGLASFEMRFLRSTPSTSLFPALGVPGIVAPIAALAFAVSTVAAGCLTAPPPTLQQVNHRPTILPNETPPVDVPLVTWPLPPFIAYVDVDPGASFEWAAFMDFNPSDPTDASHIIQRASQSAAPGGGPVQVSFTPVLSPNDGLCHRIDLVVADTFGLPTIPNYYHMPAGDYGGDVVTWWYTGGLGLADCSPYDAGPLPDGGYPIPEASTDSPPPVPE